MDELGVRVPVDVDKLMTEAVELLRDYIRIDTTNPPGDVAATADWVEALFEREGIATTRVGPSADKANVSATIGAPGGGGSVSEQALVLAHHMDVVPAVAEDWSAGPFEAEIREGYLYGRGVLDMKGFGVLSMLCAFVLHRAGASLTRPLRIIATADEEVGGVLGAKWLADNHFDDFGGELLLTEGSFGWRGKQVTFYPIVIAEKGVSTVKLTARGKPGHASAPTADNAVVRIGNAIHRLGAYRSPPRARDLARRFLAGFPPELAELGDGRSIGDLDDHDIEALILRLAGTRRSGSNVNLLRNTFTPTMVQAGVGQNIIPATAEAFVDCRSVPGVTGQELVDEIAGAIDDPEVEMELVKSSIGTESAADTVLYDALRGAILAENPEAIVVPYLTGGGTDAKHFRPKGVTCYGLIPVVLDEDAAGGVHGTDERVSLDNLEHALRVLLRVVSDVCLAPPA